MADRVVRCLSFIPKQGTRAFPSDDPGRAWLRTSSSSPLSKPLCSKQLGVLETSLWFEQSKYHQLSPHDVAQQWLSRQTS
jgi:hypothetical protein